MNDPERPAPASEVEILLAQVHHPEGVEPRARRLYDDIDGSYAAYFSAFPAAYWARWSVLDSVVLRLSVTGEGSIRVFSSDADGNAREIETRQNTPGPETVVLPLDGFEEGGWYWFDLDPGLTLVDAGWWAPSGARRARTVSATVGITTLNREEFLVPVLDAIAADREVLDLLQRIVVVDHGSRRITAAPGFSAVAELLGDKLAVIEQSNLGGSGGFSRAMLEAIDASSDAVILLDDDVVVDPESLRRLIRFEEFARIPTVVGGHMFDMANRTRLHALSEGVGTKRFFWHTNGPSRHDLGQVGLREASWLHRRGESDYTGWWMCLIPTSILREVGLSMPYFIKWDDAEFGLRAGAAGYPSVSLPGAAIWHVSWDEKDDTVSWQGYFHARNRLASALIHSPHARGGGITLANITLSVRYLFALEYGSQLLRNAAYRDILAGPDRFHDVLATQIKHNLETLATTASGTVLSESEWEALTKTTARSPYAARAGESPRPVAVAARAIPIVLRNLVPVRRSAREHPAAWLPARDARWWNVGRYDSVLTASPDSTGGRWLRRDRRQFFTLLRDAIALSLQVRREWPRLAEVYRAAAPDLVGAERWRETTSR